MQEQLRLQHVGSSAHPPHTLVHSWTKSMADLPLPSWAGGMMRRTSPADSLQHAEYLVLDLDQLSPGMQLPRFSQGHEVSASTRLTYPQMAAVQAGLPWHDAAASSSAPCQGLPPLQPHVVSGLSAILCLAALAAPEVATGFRLPFTVHLCGGSGREGDGQRARRWVLTLGRPLHDTRQHCHLAAWREVCQQCLLRACARGSRASDHPVHSAGSTGGDPRGVCSCMDVRESAAAGTNTTKLQLGPVGLEVEDVWLCLTDRQRKRGAGGGNDGAAEALGSAPTIAQVVVAPSYQCSTRASSQAAGNSAPAAPAPEAAAPPRLQQRQQGKAVQDRGGGPPNPSPGPGPRRAPQVLWPVQLLGCCMSTTLVGAHTSQAVVSLTACSTACSTAQHSTVSHHHHHRHRHHHSRRRHHHHSH